MRAFISAVVALSVGVGACHESTASIAPLTVTIQPNFGAIERCSSVQFTAFTAGRGGVAVTPDSVQWSTSDPLAATVSASGMVHTLQTSPRVTLRAVAFSDVSSGTGEITFSVFTTETTACTD